MKALHVIPPDLPVAEPGDVHDLLRCTLQAGHVGRHHSLARSLPMEHPGEVWACWSDACQPSGLLTVPDCAVRSQDGRGDACLHFNGHAGAHSWALIDPDEDALRTRLGLS